MKKQTLAGTVFQSKVANAVAELNVIINSLEVLQEYLDTDYSNEMVRKANFMLDNIIPPLKKLLEDEDMWIS